MDHFVQRRQPLYVGKRHGGKLSAIHLSAGVQNPRTKELDELIADLIFSEQLVDNGIGINNRAAQLFEFRCDGAFAGSDATDYSDQRLFRRIAHLKLYGPPTPKITPPI